ncbi:hypothetical protein ACFHYQ_13575 [Sphaerimonospora cavernae]|uniref:XRE family transcriptional regulator n=1 Tax=Sphaerimonospora cavernae TaxID=1740611 RepID=A0ABV6U4E7_9ACTN
MVTVLRQLAQAKGLVAYRHFSRAYEAAARELGYHNLAIGERQWDRWLSARLKGLPYPKACEVLEHIFDLPASELFAAAPSTTDGVDTEPGQGLTPAHLVAAPVDVQPRGMYEMMKDAASQSRDAAGDAERELGPAAMEQLQDDVVHLARTYLLRSPMGLFPELVAVRERILAKMAETRKPAQLSDLNFLAGVSSTLLAEVCIDLGEMKMAVDHARAAWSYAASIDHVPLAVWARGMMATSAYWANQPRDAVVAISKAEQHRPVGIAAARVHSIAARAWSHMGETDKTVQSIRVAMNARAADERGDELQAIGGVFDWDPVREQRCYSSALLQLLQLRRADFDQSAIRRFTGEVLAYTRQALEDAQAVPDEDRSQTVEATIGIETATAWVILGDLPNARQTLTEVLELPADLRTFPVLHRLNGLRTQLALTPAGRAAEQLSDDLASFIQGSTVRALPPGA